MTSRAMTSRSMEDRTVCITGASSGIGRAIAEHLGSLGAHVFMAGRTPAPMEESAERIREAGGSADVAVFDVTDSGRLASWIDGAAASTGRLDVMVSNAGFGDIGSTLVDGDPDTWRSMLEVNVLALAVGCQAAIRAMRSTGSDGNLINISSVAATRRDSGMYGATKHAVNCLNASLRKEVEDDPIRVTSIMPGVVATNFMRNMDRDLIGAIAAGAGIDPEFDDEGRLPQEQLDQFQAHMPSMAIHADHVAQAVAYVVGQPVDVNVEELVIRPPKSMF